MRVFDLKRRHHVTVPFAGLQGNDALPAATVGGKFLERRELAVAALRSREDVALAEGDQRDQALPQPQAHAAHAGGLAAPRPDFLFLEAERLPPAVSTTDS